MMEDELIDQSFSASSDYKKNDDDGCHKKNDDADSKTKSTESSKPLVEQAKEFVLFMLESAKNLDKRTMLLHKQNHHHRLQ